jgi:glycosyltransferase involved in cell wall biosynthesis
VRYREPSVRVLFFNEGNLGGYIMGQAQVQAAISAGLTTTPDIKARFATLSPMSRLENALAVRRIEPLASWHLDFSALRWHLVQSQRARRHLRAELDAWPADVVHLHTQSVALTMNATMRSVPVVLSIDTTTHDWQSMPAWALADRASSITRAPIRALERRALRTAALVLAWTPWAQRGVQRDAPQARVVQHHPGLDLRRFVPAPKRERARPRVLFVGGRFVEKGGEDLLAALGERLGRDVDLDLVTPHPVAERPGVQVHRLQTSDPRLLELYQQADLLALPTYGDATPWVVLEAMACGTPVLSTPVGGIPDMLDGGRAGALVPYGDVAALKETLDGLLASPDRLASLGARARERCEVHYDAEKQFVRLTEHLREARTSFASSRAGVS